MNKNNRLFFRRWILGIAFLAIVIIAARPAIHLCRIAFSDRDNRSLLPKGYVDDASRMNAIWIKETFPVASTFKEAEQQLVNLLQRARNENLKVSIAGARHSMGAHTIYPGGIMIDTLPFNSMFLDKTNHILTVGSGAKWSEILPYLDKQGYSVAIMQSNNSFSVGGSISVNCHGWQYEKPPIASSVESFRLMIADGSIVNCSRQENTELFCLALGGYGLFGIILDVRLHVVPNEIYQLKQFIVSVNDSFATYDQQLKSAPNVSMVYARLSVSKENFLNEVILNMFYKQATKDPLPPIDSPGMTELRRAIFRGSAENDYGKKLRWTAETKLQPHIRNKTVTRNQLFNESVHVFENRSAHSTDILHEYFIPREGVEKFIVNVRKIVSAHQGDLLNVTVRFVDTDKDSFLKYADQPVYAFVMLFTQPTSSAGNAQMQAMTRELIDASLSSGGRYYLPYRLHATTDQFHKAYPQAEEFFKHKRKYDPMELFQNQFYTQYGK